MNTVSRMICRSALFLLAVILLAGCPYTTKAVLPENIRKIYIPVFVNRTTQFNIESLMTDAVIRGFTSEGRLVEGGYLACVNSREQADAMLEGEIVQYILERSVVDEKGVVQEYRMRILTNLTLTDLQQNKVLWAEKNKETRQRIYWKVSPAVGIPQTEQEAQSNVFKALAKDIVSRTIWGW